MRSSVPFVTALSATALCCLALAGAAGAEPLRFTKVGNGSTKLFIVGGRVGFTTSAVVVDPYSDVVRPQDLEQQLDRTTFAALDRVQWNRRYVVGVMSAWPTHGYRVFILRVSLQHIGSGAVQLCVVAARQAPRPGPVVLQEPTSTYAFISIARAAPGERAPQAVVLRGPHDRLLYKTAERGSFNSFHPVRPNVCHAR